MGLKECCRRNVVTSAPAARVSEIVRLMEEKNVGSVVLVEGRKPVGILTDRDIVIRAVAKGLEIKTTRAEEIMTRDPLCLREDTGLYEALKQLQGKRFRRIPVVDAKGQLTGIVTLDDLIRLLAQELSFISTVLEEQVPSV